jgi:hypothetical protein
VAALLGVGLVALEVVDRRAHGLASLLVRADRVDAVPGDLQRLKWNHHLVVFNEVSNQHQDLFGHV